LAFLRAEPRGVPPKADSPLMQYEELLPEVMVQLELLAQYIWLYLEPIYRRDEELPGILMQPLV